MKKFYKLASAPLRIGFFLFGVFSFTLSHFCKSETLPLVSDRKELVDNDQIRALLEISNKYRQARLPDSSLFYANLAMAKIGDRDLPYLKLKSLRLIVTSYVMKDDYLKAKTFLPGISAKGIAEELSEQEELESALNYKAIVVSYFGKYDSAIYYFGQSLAINKKLGNTQVAAMRLASLGRIYMHMGSYPIAINYLFDSWKQTDQDDLMNLSIINLNLGKCYMLLEDFEKAKLYTKRSLVGFEKLGNSVVGLYESHSVLGNVYSQFGMSDTCFYHLNKCIQICKDAGIPDGVAEGNYYFSLHYQREGNWEDALTQAERAYQIYMKEKAMSRALLSMVAMANSHAHLGNLDEGFHYANKGLGLARDLKSKDIEKEFLNILSELYAESHDYAKAYQYRVAYSAVRDSVFSEAKTRHILNMEAIYESQKRENELALAQADQKASLVRLEEQKIRETFLILGLIVTAALLAIGAYLYESLRATQKTVQAQNIRLQKLNETKDRFFAIVGHDLRGPIASFSGINNLINWYIEKNDLKKIKELGVNITKSADQLDTLLNNLLSWAMTQTEGIPYHPHVLRLRELTDEITELFSNQLQAKEITLLDATADDLYVFADRNALLLVLRNLTSNALKFTPNGGSIEIGAHWEADAIKIEVRDTGVGMPAEKLLTLFELHEEKSTPGTANEKGAGLGLILCKEYVEINKGRLSVSSEEHHGSVFSFTIPYSAHPMVAIPA